MSPVEKYIASFDGDIQIRLKELRQLFFEINPGAQESIRYNMPAFKVGNYRLYFSGYSKHIGFYPVGRFSEIEDEVAPYRAKGTKDSLHFKHTMPLPTDLIKKIIIHTSKKS
jgi:uncharacterized protein YdhG (YjbR/CyaY superfamily)